MLTVREEVSEAGDKFDSKSVLVKPEGAETTRLRRARFPELVSESIVTVLVPVFVSKVKSKLVLGAAAADQFVPTRQYELTAFVQRLVVAA
jgi:hypothetical protein